MTTTAPCALILGPGTYGDDHHLFGLASFRLRVLPFLKAINQMGWTYALPGSVAEACEVFASRRVDLIYVGKWNPQVGEAAQLCFELFELINHPSSGTPVFRIADICENNFVDLGWHADYFDYWIQSSDLLISGSTALADEVIKPRVGSNAALTIIPDCIEDLKLQTGTLGDGLGWFGHASNLCSLAQEMIANPENRQAFTIVTRVDQGLAELQSKGLLKPLIEAWPNAQLLPYEGTDSLIKQLQLCSKIVIPVDCMNSRKRFSSHNRLTTSLLLGMQVFASPLPAYQDFSELVVISDEPLKACLACQDAPVKPDPGALLSLLAPYQLEAIISDWLEIFDRWGLR